MTDRPGAARVRRGLVFGAGGVLGFAWMIGALAALEAEEGFDARDVEICIGTSAGSVLAALLGCGVSVEAMLRHQQGIPIPGDLDLGWDYDRDSGGALPPRPDLGLGSPDLLRRIARHPRHVPPLVVLSAVLPRGRGTLEPLRRMIERVSRPLGDSGPSWPTQPQVWLIAMDYSGGQRVAFGRDGAPPAGLPAAVIASCAIPGWYAPIVIDGRRYVDGGATSPTSLDLLAGRGLHEVHVLAPMASFAYDRPRSPVALAERRLRRTVTRRVLAEATKVRRAGTEVTLLGPGPEDLRVIGANLMDPRRRTAVLATSLRTSAEALRRTAGIDGPSRRTGTAGQ
ncbi:MAG: patatin-like phospholipase family protein [Mycobacteriales bacterium]